MTETINIKHPFIRYEVHGHLLTFDCRSGKYFLSMAIAKNRWLRVWECPRNIAESLIDVYREDQALECKERLAAAERGESVELKRGDKGMQTLLALLKQQNTPPNTDT